MRTNSLRKKCHQEVMMVLGFLYVGKTHTCSCHLFSQATVLRYHCLLANWQQYQQANLPDPICDAYLSICHFKNPLRCSSPWILLFLEPKCYIQDGLCQVTQAFLSLLKRYFQFCITQVPSVASYYGNVRTIKHAYLRKFPLFPHSLQVENHIQKIPELKFQLMLLSLELLGAQ